LCGWVAVTDTKTHRTSSSGRERRRRPRSRKRNPSSTSKIPLCPSYVAQVWIYISNPRVTQRAKQKTKGKNHHLKLCCSDDTKLDSNCFFSVLQIYVDYLDLFDGHVIPVRLEILHLDHHLLSLGDSPKHGVLVVQPGNGGGGDEPLGGIGVWLS